MAMHKIRKGDDVIVRTGRDRGKRGSVLRVLEDDRLLVENINMVKRHTRPNPQKNVTGGIIEKEAPIHVSNVALYNNAANRGERVGIKTLEDGRKVRVFRKSGEVADVR
jgi:large subunit ribosomal protein L24